jgi:TatD DNase family protein
MNSQNTSLGFELIDSHAHVYSSALFADRNTIYDRLTQAKVSKVVLPNIDLTTVGSMLQMADERPESYFPAIGLHPSHVFADYKEVLSSMEALLSSRTWIAIGECGLDYYHDLSFTKEQGLALEIQIEWAKSMGLPIILHTRDATEAVMKLVSKHQDGRLRGVFHCFSESAQLAKEITGLGFMLGIGGVMTYPKANVKELVKDYPTESIILETDSPYLSPVPYRGKVNEPSYLTVINRALAESLSLSEVETARITTDNAKRLFNF